MTDRTPRQLADDLIGTSDHAYPEELLQTKEELQEFDQYAFNCDGCGWWCDTEELNNETARNLCNDCATEDAE